MLIYRKERKNKDEFERASVLERSCDRDLAQTRVALSLSIKLPINKFRSPFQLLIEKMTLSLNFN